MRSLFQEWLLIRRNVTLWGIVGLLFLLMTGAAVNGVLRTDQMRSVTDNLNTEESATQAALKATVERWEQNPTEDVPAVTSPGAVGLSILAHYSVLPTRALSPLAVGQSDVQKQYYRVDGHSAHTFMDKSETTNPLNVLSGSFDMAFVIVFLLPVFIIALTFDLLSKEKEHGMLAIILAHGKSLQHVVLSKSFALALIIFAVIFGAGFLSLLIVGADLGSAETWLDFGLWISVVALYGFFWFALALLINSFNLASVANGVILANLWLVFVVVIPAVVNVVATTLYPAPSRVELTTEMREASSKAEEDAAQAREAFFFDHPDMTDAGASEDFFLQVLATEAAVERSVAHLVEAFDVQADKRENMVAALQYFSPAILAQEALSVVSGTDTARFRGFASQTLSFHDQWRDFFSAKVMTGERMKAEDFDAIPRFSYQALGTSEYFAKSLRLTLALAAMLGVIMVWSVIRYRDYPIVERK